MIVMDQFEIDDRLDKLLAQAESDIEKVFAKRLKTILYQISEMYRKYEKNGELSFTELNKYNRFQKEMKLIADMLTDHYREVIKIIEEQQETQYVAKYLLTAYLLQMSVSDATEMGFSIPTTEVIQAVLLNPIAELTLPKVMERHRGELIHRINIEIAQGLLAGESYSQLASRLERRLGMSATKARLVARTEGGRARSLAAEQVNEVASQYVDSVKVWASSLDNRVRKSHRSLDGKEADKNGVFKYKKNFTTAPRLWVGPDAAALSIQCRCSIIYKVGGKLPEYRRGRDYMDAGYQQKLANRIDKHMANEGLTYKQAVKKAQNEINPPSTTIPYVTYEVWKEQLAGQE